MRKGWVGLLGAGLALGVLAGPAALPAVAAPATPTITLIDTQNQPLPGDPQVGQEFAAQSAETYDVGSPQSTAWRCAVDFGDGSAASGYFRAKFPPAPCAQFHTYAQPGTYTITMTVTDAAGSPASSSRVVTVGQPQVTAVDGGVEGSRVQLTAPAGSSSYAWTAGDPEHCTVLTPTAPTTGVRCDDQGSYTFAVRGDSNATSAQYVVTYVNGRPRPAIKPVRYRFDPAKQKGRNVRSPRVGTGDDLRWLVDAHDPSWRLAGSDLLGDDLSCRFDYGDGTTGEDSGRTFDGCLGFHVYTEPGLYRARVTVTDDSGAVGRASAKVRVVRRDVHVQATGRQADGLRGTVVGGLNPRGVQGRMRFTTPQGRHVVVRHVDRISVGTSEVTLQGPATVDGQGGYFVFAEVERRGSQVVMLQVDQGDRDGAWTVVEDATGSGPGWARVAYTAPAVG